MSSTRQEIKAYIETTVNAHLKAHKQASLTPENWTKVIEGRKSANIADDIAAKFGVEAPAKLSDFASIDDAVDYAYERQQN